jgi:hypothetical protein
MGNGGDPSNHRGPFRDDQLYLNFSELMTVYPFVAMAWMEADLPMTDHYFPVVMGALLGFRSSVDDGLLHAFDGEKWRTHGS